MENEFDQERYFKSIKKQAEYIRTQSLNFNQTKFLLNQLVSDMGTYIFDGNRKLKDENLFQEAVFEFLIALNVAVSNYRRENKASWWVKIKDLGAGQNYPSIDINALRKQNN